MVTKWAIFKAFGTLEGPKKTSDWAQVGLISLVCAPHVVHNYFLRHIADVEGSKGLFVTRKSRRTRSVWNITSFVHLDAELRPFWPNKAVLGHEVCSFGRAPPHLSPLPCGTNGERLAHNLDLARAPSRVQDVRSKKGRRRWDGGTGTMETSCACLLVVSTLSSSLVGSTKRLWGTWEE